MKHGVNWHLQWYQVGDQAAIYPFPRRGIPFVGTVQKIKTNRYKRISYVVDNKEWQAEELFPDRKQVKLRIRCMR